MHAAWGRLPSGSWATRDEAAYPSGLCRFWAHCLRGLFPQLGLREPTSFRNRTDKASLFAQRAALGLIPQGPRSTGALNPFCDEIEVRLSKDTDPMLLQPGRSVNIPGAPKGCRALRVVPEPNSWLVRLGVPEVCSFHPAPWNLLQQLHRLPAREVATARCRFLQSVLQVARELDAEEALAPHMEFVLKGKRLLLFQKLLNSVGHEDTALIRDMCQGFTLVG